MKTIKRTSLTLATAILGLLSSQLSYAEQLVNLWRSRTGICQQTQSFLQERFTVEHMVGTFVQTIASQPR